MNQYCIHSKQSSGSAHSFCQDHYRVLRHGDHLILVVADGHGGTAYTRSDIGASFACAAAEAVLLDGTEPASVPAAIKDRYDAMVADHLNRHPLCQWETDHLGDTPPHGVYGATLLAAVLSDQGTDLYQLGDGEIHTLNQAGAFLPELPADDHCQGNLTSSLANNRDFVLNHFRVSHCDIPVAAIMLFSDGCDGGFLQIAQALTDPENLKSHLQAVFHRTDRGDDQTLLLAYDPEIIADESFQLCLRSAVQTAQAEARKATKAEQDRLELARLREYLSKALGIAQQMQRTGNPSLPVFLETIKPSYRRFEALTAQYSKLPE